MHPGSGAHVGFVPLLLDTLPLLLEMPPLLLPLLPPLDELPEPLDPPPPGLPTPEVFPPQAAARAIMPAKRRAVERMAERA